MAIEGLFTTVRKMTITPLTNPTSLSRDALIGPNSNIAASGSGQN